ncbi:glycosyltransferase [Polaromonas sp.]|nr:glycosyltransferase [Candidatus Saccharibacteria bacterium]
MPVLNESENVLPLIARISAVLSNHPTEVLFIDDSRNKLTVTAVKTAILGYNNAQFAVRIFHRQDAKRWGGLSGAVADGFKRAHGGQVIVMDGDLQHPPETLPSLIAAGEKYDLVVASRYRSGGSASGLSGGLRHLVSRSSTILAKMVFPHRLRPVSDPMTGFFLVNRSLINVKLLRPKGFKILLEIIVSHPRLTIGEVPLQFAKRVAGESHGTMKQGLEFVAQLISLRFSRPRRMFMLLPKVLQFSVIGGSVFALGMALLYILVDIYSVPVAVANAIQLIVTFAANFYCNKHLTWNERIVSPTAAKRFVVARSITTLLNYGLFLAIVNFSITTAFAGRTIYFTMDYLLANVICLIAIMVLNFVISDKWVFSESSLQGKQPQAQRTPLPVFKLSIITLLIALFFAIRVNASLTYAVVLALAGLALFIQASVEVWRMIYAFREPDAVDRLKFPALNRQLRQKFCLIVPARHEAAVLGQTLEQLSLQTHPNVDIISVLCDDDLETIAVAEAVANGNPRLTVMRYPLAPESKPSKPKQLNYVLSQIADQDYTVIGVIDAEDSVHPELVARIDSAFNAREVGIVQGGVQLMNFDSSWYAMHNVVEYYRWFNSAMAFQADQKFMPLGGNTIFIRHALLKAAGGWPLTLTEDCSLGVLLSTRFQTKMAVYYEPRLATREETPDSLKGLFHQRVRWNQGFYHEWRKGIWHELPTLRQRILAGYVLSGPVILASITSFLCVTLVATFFLNAPVGLVMLMYIPLVPVTLLTLLNVVFLHDFGQAFERKIKLRHYATLLLTQFVYQTVLNAAAFWSIVRELRGDTSWYKTPHTGQHRLNSLQPATESYMAGSAGESTL